MVCKSDKKDMSRPGFERALFSIIPFEIVVDALPLQPPGARAGVLRVADRADVGLFAMPANCPLIPRLSCFYCGIHVGYSVGLNNSFCSLPVVEL